MSDFKLIAMRPLNGCNRKFCKNLKTGKVFKFYDDYSFEFEGDQVKDVTHKQTTPKGLYDIKQEGRIDPISINISAIVGRNGSGKSTLLELLYVGIYVIASHNKLLEPNIEAIDRELNENEVNLDRKDYLERIKFEIQEIYKTLKLEIYYTIDDSIFCILIDDEIKQTFLHGPAAIRRNYAIDSILDIDSFNFDHFFYNIAVNYSIYGLNSVYVGDWIESLFHKNDGYQTPVVINPMRDEGRIDINNETHLAQSRLLANLVDDTMQTKEVLQNKIVDRIDFEIDEDKLELYKQYMRLDKIIDRVTSDTRLTIDQIFQLTYRYFIDKSNDPQFDPNVKHLYYIKRYVIKKLVKIASNYDEYDDYYVKPESRESPPSIRNIDDFLKKLITDNSHITLKLKQILNTVRFNLLREENNGKKNPWQGLEFSLPLSEFIDRIKAIKSEHDSINIIELIPGALVNPTIHIANDSSPESVSKFNALSSGEQQFIHSIQSILYHLINLNSVFASDRNDSKITFRNINIVLDEIELYFHPELQQSLIFELLKGIERLKINNIKSINILCLTHSPFILSDIPVANTLRLTDGDTEPLPSENTFGANIYDLLADDFFLKDSFMGMWANGKIKSVVSFLNKTSAQIELDTIKKQSPRNKAKEALLESELMQAIRLESFFGKVIPDKDYCLEVIRTIGEPVLRSKLLDMYDNLFKISSAKDALLELARQSGLKIEFKN